MNQINALVLRAAGTNCDKETDYAFRSVGINPESIHINRLLENPSILLNYQILAIPGGFSYGDDIGAGRLFANEIRYKISDIFLDFVSKDSLIIGICNGFQVLVRLGILPGNSEVHDKFQKPSASLHWNDSHKFEDRWVYCEVPKNNKSIFFNDIETITLPIAHAEGKFIMESEDSVKELEKAGQVVLKYANKSGGEVLYPANPNGSMLNVAGVCDNTGKILGMMPHPERILHNFNSPFATRNNDAEQGEGLQIFQNIAKFFS